MKFLCVCLFGFGFVFKRMASFFFRVEAKRGDVQDTHCSRAHSAMHSKAAVAAADSSRS
jgi:hypothetical protein